MRGSPRRIFMKRNTPNHVDAWQELRQVLQDWRAGEGGLIGLLVAWWQVVSGRVAVGKLEYR